jgi:hypothetical protein
VSVADVDSAALTTTLTVGHGTLTATGAGVSGSGTATLTIAGSAAQVNAALGTLGYRGNADFNGADTLTVATSDGSSSDTDTVAITVNPVDDAPVNTVPGTQIGNEDVVLPITGLSVADLDSLLLVTRLTVAHGTLGRHGSRRRRQRHRDPHDPGPARADQCGARDADLSRRSQLQRCRHAERLDLRRNAH